MNHDLRRLNQTRLTLVTLESRVTPGSLLMTGLDAGMGEVLPRSESSHDLGVLTAKKIQDDQIQIVSPTKADDTFTVSNTAPGSQGIVQQETSSLTTQQASGTIARSQVNPGLRAPKATGAVLHGTTGRAGNQVRPDVVAVQGQHFNMPTPKVHSVGALQVQQGSPFQMEHHVCEGSKAFVPVYNTYQGAGLTDEVIEITSGKGGNIGKSYAAENRGGTDGFIQRYSASGACEVSISITDTAGVTLTAMEINQNGVYVTGNTNDNQLAFVTRFDADLTAGSAITATLEAPSGGSLAFSGIGLGQGGADPDVHIGGRLDDPAFGLGYNTTLEIRVEKDLTTSGQSYTNAVDFGGDSEIHGVAADRPNNAYFYGRTQGAAGEGDSPLAYRLNNDGVTRPWAYYFTFDGTFNADPVNIGKGRAKFLGGTTEAGGIYFGGTQGYQATLPTDVGAFTSNWVKISPDGTFNPEDYNFVLYSGGGGDLATRDIAVDRTGILYPAARRSDSGTVTEHKGRVYEWDGAAILFQQNYGTAGDGFDYDVNGVDLATSSATAPMQYGGKTNNTAVSSPPLAGCDVTYNGGAYDGFAAASTQTA